MQKEVLLSYFPLITHTRYQQMVGFFSSLEQAWQGNFTDFKQMGWKNELVNEFLQWRNGVDEDKIEKDLKQARINCLTQASKNYPLLLKEIYDPPFCLFARGEIEAADFNLAVVGSRKFTIYGQQITEKIVSELSGQGLIIVSGLALGIDGIAHRAALQAKGKTIAVLGGGINKQHIYPTAHKQLAEDIINKGGAIISEYPPGTSPTHFSFPKRNRIIAGLSLATLVIEAAEKSGALSTAQYGLDNNREIMAVPQNITSANALGTNNLIKNGAQLVASAQDVLIALGLQNSH